ncbi:MAG: CAP domain-containing protein [Actinomycetota bacterium]
MRRLFVTFLFVGLIGAGASARPAAGVQYLSGDESRVISLVNGTRSGKGLQSLGRNSGLANMAREQSVRMLAKGNIFHNTNLGGDIEELNVTWKIVGENVGMGPNVDLIEDAFLKSPDHYKNIVRPNFNSIGVGVVQGDGKVFVTQVFAEIQGAKAAPAPAAPAPAQTAPPAAVAPAQAAPAAATAPPATPKPTPTPPRPDPNALKSGLIASDPLPPTPAEPASPAAEESGSVLDTIFSGLRRLADILGFWA